MALFTAIFKAVATAVTSAMVAAGVPMTPATIAIAYGATIAITGGVIFGGVTLSRSLANRKNGLSDSPTYGGNTLTTQTNNRLPIPLIYGEVKLAGNRIYQGDNTTGDIRRLVAFGEGEIEDFTDIRLNDIKAKDISKIKIQKYYGTANQQISNLVTEANTNAGRAEIVGSLKHLAYLAISVPPSDKISGDYNLTAVVKGRKVKVYTDENTYTVKYSNNPVWCCLDLLTSYNGLRLGMDNLGNFNNELLKKQVDIQSFIEAAAYCDELVDGEKRFTFNMIFDSNWLIRDCIEEIKKNCRGALVTKGKKLQFKIDKPESVSKVFNKTDIIQGSEIVKTIEKADRYDILDIRYIDPKHEWSQVTARAELDEYFNEPAISHSVDILSITNFKQASRMAWYYLNRNIRCYFYGQFATDYRASDLEIGDVIQLNDLVMGFENFKAKVTGITDDNSGVFTVSWQQYDESIYTDQQASLEPVIIRTNVNNPYAYPNNVQSFNVSQNNNLLEFAWTAVSNQNATYEIREGASWESSKLVATGLTGTTYTTSLKQKGIFTYWIKAKAGYNYSQNATSDILNVQYIPSLNTLIEKNVLEDAQGTFCNTYLYNGKLKLNPIIKWQDLTPEKWQDNGNRYYADAYNKWSTIVVESGYYESQIYDIGDNLPCIIKFNYEFYGNDQSSVEIQWQYSKDCETWSDWIIANTGSFTFRYFRIKAIMQSPNGNATYLSNFIVTVDVPDREENYTNREIVDANEGVTIYYATDVESKQAKDFIISEPHVLATPKNIDSYAVITSSTSTSCTIKLYKNDGTLTTGFVNITVKGY